MLRRRKHTKIERQRLKNHLSNLQLGQIQCKYNENGKQTKKTRMVLSLFALYLHPFSIYILSLFTTIN